MRHLPLALVAVVSIVGCQEATVPPRPLPYSFTMGRLDDGFPLIFRWPRHVLPVRYWVEPSNGLPEMVRRAIREWERVAVYGEFKGVLTTDSSNADVLVLSGSSDLRNSESVLACRGIIRWDVALDTTIVLPVRVSIASRVGFASSDVQPCLERLAVKFVGHSLGMFPASPFEDDLLFDLPTIDRPSPRDRATFSTLYHTQPTVGVPEHR